MKITSFEGDYAFLSNFYPSIIYPDYIEYPTVEHAYQAMKTLNPLAREVIRLAKTPAAAKKYGKIIELRNDWESIKIDVMHKLLEMKFSSAQLSEKLLATNNIPLLEGNYWNDTFWGVCRGAGSNHLGNLLMKIREDLKSGKVFSQKMWM